MKILVIMELSDKKCRDKLTPLCQLKEITKIVVLRRSKGPTLKKVEYITPARFFQSNPLVIIIWKIILGIQIIKKENIDVIGSFYFFPHNFIAVMLGFLFNRPTIASLIGSDINRWFENKFLERLFLLILHRNIVTFVTGGKSKQKILLKGLPNHKIKILPNSIDVEKFYSDQVERTIDLIFIGNLVPVKRVEIIIAIMKSISEKFSNVKLIVLGSGSEEKRLRKKANELDLKTNITFVGYSNNANYWLNRSKILLLTSKNEGRPAVIMEAMVCGTVPIVLDVGDIKDMCQSGVDSIVIKNTSNFKQQFIEQVISVLKDDEYWNFLSENARKRRENFSYSKTASVWKVTLTQYFKSNNNK